MKKYLLGLFAVVLAIGFSAFTSAPKKNKNVDYLWFIHNGGSVSDPASYLVDENQTEFGCNAEEGTLLTCRILAPFTEPEPEVYVADFSEVISFTQKQGDGDEETSVRLKNPQ